MKVLFIIGLIMAGALVVKAGKDLCGFNHDKIKELLTCMGEHVSSEVKRKASEIIHSGVYNLDELFKEACARELKTNLLIEEFFTQEDAAVVQEAYEQCNPGYS